MIKTYKKKPVEVQAIQWTGENDEEIKEFCNSNCYILNWDYVAPKDLIIHTLEGNMLARVGDYIIRGVKGEFYPCKPDIFEQTYYEVGFSDYAFD